jgi:hypothetical protein
MPTRRPSSIPGIGHPATEGKLISIAVSVLSSAAAWVASASWLRRFSSGSGNVTAESQSSGTIFTARDKQPCARQPFVSSLSPAASPVAVLLLPRAIRGLSARWCAVLFGRFARWTYRAATLPSVPASRCSKGLGWSPVSARIPRVISNRDCRRAGTWSSRAQMPRSCRRAHRQEKSTSGRAG